MVVIQGSCDFLGRNPSDSHGSHSYCDSEDMMFLNCHTIFEDHEIKGPCSFMGGNFSWLAITLPRFAAISIVVVEL